MTPADKVHLEWERERDRRWERERDYRAFKPTPIQVQSNEPELKRKIKELEYREKISDKVSIARTFGGLVVALLGIAILCFTLVILIGTYSHDLGSWSRWFYIGIIAYALTAIPPFGVIGGLILWTMVIGAVALGVFKLAVWIVIAWGIAGWIMPPIINAIAGRYSGY